MLLDFTNRFLILALETFADNISPRTYL